MHFYVAGQCETFE